MDKINNNNRISKNNILKIYMIKIENMNKEKYTNKQKLTN